jgi:hypothetical protein
VGENYIIVDHKFAGTLANAPWIDRGSVSGSYHDGTQTQTFTGAGDKLVGSDLESGEINRANGNANFTSSNKAANITQVKFSYDWRDSYCNTTQSSPTARQVRFSSTAGTPTSVDIAYSIHADFLDPATSWFGWAPETGGSWGTWVSPLPLAYHDWHVYAGMIGAQAVGRRELKQGDFAGGIEIWDWIEDYVEGRVGNQAENPPALRMRIG